MADCHLLGFCQMPIEAQAAWVQAIGSILAILVAVYLPWRQRKNDRVNQARVEAQKARALAHYLLPALDSWVARFDDFETNHRQPGGKITNADLLHASTPQQGLFSPPFPIGEDLKRLYLLGGAADVIFDVLRISFEARASAEVLLTQCSPANDFAAGGALLAEIWSNYASVRQRVQTALAIIRARL